MKINNIGYNHRHDADFNINRPNGSGDYLMLLLKTPALFCLNKEEFITQPDSFILFQKGTPQYYRASEESFANDWFHFNAEETDLAFLQSLNIPFDRVVPIGNLSALSLIVQNLCYEYYSANFHKEETVSLYLKIFFLKLSEKMQASADSTVSSYFDKLSILRSKIYNMPYQNWTVDGLAHEMSVSRSYFQHLYKQYFGINVMSDVIASRIEHSKYLLINTDFPIRRIAEQCGYRTELHFMRQFKNAVGMTPSQYRRQS